MAHILKPEEAEDGEGLVVLVDWTGFEKDEHKWEQIGNNSGMLLISLGQSS